ncbi:WW domain-containing protein ASCRUDRAFT_67990 [Ascoidea rubescens DSM 1968]|uniref:WW domain-containing protein n=1 Tax=Ascoidea rubescens DSM 1968 TaxID=1344418 RepID=A0A1D2VQU6_9ASCO|nr:hypothetical protein ASCRUDRAFT_67990 [Ascoidea rubescens DSM 1968]ODV63937.1 hypothetical protein ASCRUDRAFT_67990 [Ascoidea rubescens DSM 1968]
MNIKRPSQPPPPSIPDGWLAVWDEEYQCYFYVNKYTNESTWELPTRVPPQHPPQTQTRSQSQEQYYPANTQQVQQIPQQVQQVPQQVQQQPQVQTTPVQTGPSKGSMVAAGAGLFALGSLSGRRRRPVAVVPVGVRPGRRRF